jgi:hypothetical protein
VTSQLGTGKSLTFFTVCDQKAHCSDPEKAKSVTHTKKTNCLYPVLSVYNQMGPEGGDLLGWEVTLYV